MLSSTLWTRLLKVLAVLVRGKFYLEVKSHFLTKCLKNFQWTEITAPLTTCELLLLANYFLWKVKLGFLQLLLALFNLMVDLFWVPVESARCNTWFWSDEWIYRGMSHEYDCVDTESSCSFMENVPLTKRSVWVRVFTISSYQAM